MKPGGLDRDRNRSATATRRGDRAIQTVSLSLYRFSTPGDRFWAFSQMLFARFALRRAPDITFFKLCGSGTGEGFTPRPNLSVYAILAVWPSFETAGRRIAELPVFRRYRERAGECCTVFLAPASARGRWAGVTPFTPTSPKAANAHRSIAVLTRARLKPSKLLSFWRRAPAISKAIGANADVALKIGLGEVPWLNQCTFSIWPDTATMAAFAHADGPHARAIRAVREEGWFAEELYARFAVLDVIGAWEGQALPIRLKLAETAA